MRSSSPLVEIKFFKPEDEDELLQFFDKNLDTFNIFSHLWKWRKNEASYSGGERAIIAKKGGQIVGCVGIVPAYVKLKGKSIKTSWQQDSVVSLSMRGKGLGKQLVSSGAEGWGLVIAKGTSKPMYRLRKSLGFLDVPNSDYLLRVCKPRHLSLERLKKSLLEWMIYIWKSSVTMLIPRPNTLVKIEEIDSFDKSFDDLAETLSKENTLRIFKGQGYLNWRYFKCPVKEYKIFKAYFDGKIGAIILNITGANSDEGWIVDLLCAPENKKCAYALIMKTIEYFDHQNVSKIWVFSTLPVKRKWLFRFGFVRTYLTPRFTYRSQVEALSLLRFDHMQWDFSHGDGDLELYS